MPRRNFGFEKRQKEIAKKEKKQLKLQKRLERSQAPDGSDLPEGELPMEDGAADETPGTDSTD
ncbi:MAG: hypothetical protein IPI92_18210 [Gemmatimonadetes bacterium]|nr:hypothetical protein [Gemmatimonadota bacterium]MBK7785173.1 hypothetical protein [Gemmatimonadota bacterium]